MTNPFEDENSVYSALVNAEEQYSLWPVHIDVPPGWQVRFGPETRSACLAYIESNWVDMRPKSLVVAMQAMQDG